MAEPLFTREQIEACYDPTAPPCVIRIDGIPVYLSEWPDDDDRWSAVIAQLQAEGRLPAIERHRK